MNKSHPKLDPRLNFILSLSEPDLQKLNLRERDKLGVLAEEAQKLAGKDPESDKLLEFHSKLFCPVLHGVCLPDQQEIHPDPLAEEPYLSGFLKFQGNQADLHELGIKVRSRAGDVYSVFLPQRLVEPLAGMAAVDKIELANPILPSLNQVRRRHGIETLQRATPPITGAGVIVGVYDSALDVYHPNFRNDDGRGTDGLGSTRVLFLWDQNKSAKPGEHTPNDNTPGIGLGYGVEYVATDIDRELSRPAGSRAYQTVRHGGSPGVHGSRVAGCAVGNGRAVRNAGDDPGAFAGTAPEADIIFVGWRLRHHIDPVGVTPYSDNTFLADGLSYIFARAAELRRPCVINVSETDDQGPHDGSSLGQQFINNLLDQPDRAVVCAAGNSNGRKSHASGIVATGTTENVTLKYGGRAENDDVVQVWYSGDDRISITVTTPSSERFGPVAPGETLNQPMSNGERICITSVVDDSNNHDNWIGITITASNAKPVPEGSWSLRLTGDTIIDGRFDIWVDRNNQKKSDFGPPHVTENTGTIGDLGTTERVLTVGSTDKVGDPERVSIFSGCGPTRDGRTKPEITAYGNGVTTVRSRNMNSGSPGNFYMTDLDSGTSFSAPTVAGAVALLFQCKGAGLNWADIKHLLIQNADTTGLSVPENDHGFGRLRAAGICPSPTVDVDVWIRKFTNDQGQEPCVAPVFWDSADIEILDSAKTPAPALIAGTDNFLRVIVRNRGNRVASNTMVHLYWDDAATNMPFPGTWRRDNICTDTRGDGSFSESSNKIVIPELAPGGDASVVFGFRPPPRNSNVRGGDHFGLLAFAENQDDLTDLALGNSRWPLTRTDNNLAMRNVHVRELGDDGDASFQFWLRGTSGRDRLVIHHDAEGAKLEIGLPARALPYRDMALINDLGQPLPPYPAHPPVSGLQGRTECDCARLELTSCISGAAHGVFDHHHFVAFAESQQIVFEEIKVGPGAKLPIRINLRGVKLEEHERRLHAAQYSDGRATGGVTLFLPAHSGPKP